MIETATDKRITIAIGRKTSHNYNSTEVRLELEIELGSDENADDMIDSTTIRLRNKIRDAFRSLSEK